MSGNHYSTADLDAIRNLASQGKTAIEIATLLNRTPVGIRKACTRHGIQLLYIVDGVKHPRFCGSNSPFYKNGWTIDKNGYKLIHLPDHPFANSSNYVREHRLVMENKLGRYLNPLEVVHHIDGDKLNNHPDNLELFSKNSEHLKVELTGKVPKWTPAGLESIRIGSKKPRKSKYSDDPVLAAKICVREASKRYRAKKKKSENDALL